MKGKKSNITFLECIMAQKGLWAWRLTDNPNRKINVTGEIPGLSTRISWTMFTLQSLKKKNNPIFTSQATGAS